MGSLSLRYGVLEQEIPVSGGGTYETDPYTGTMTAYNAPSPFVVHANNNWDSAGSDPGSGGRYAGWRAFNKINTYADSWIAYPDGGPFWLKIDMGTDVNIWKYGISPRDGAAGGTPKTWIIQGSANESTWNDVDTITNYTTWNGMNWYYWEVDPPSAAYRYWRIYCTLTYSTYCAISEMDYWRFIP